MCGAETRLQRFSSHDLNLSKKKEERRRSWLGEEGRVGGDEEVVARGGG